MTQLSGVDQELVEVAARLIGEHGREPNHTVAAAARDSNGDIHSGVNLFHFTGGPCAELVALANAAATTDAPLVAMVAVGNRHRGPIAPCGRCRQVMLDYFPTIAVLVPGPAGVERMPVKDLLAYSFVRADQDT